MGQARSLDFTNVKDGGTFRKTRQEAGDYKGLITKAATVKKKDSKDEQWLFTIKVGAGQYPYYCKHVENQLWKVRNIFVAAGITIPKKRVKVDPNMVVGKKIGVILEDDEYDGRVQSNIQAIIPLAELDEVGPADDDEDETDEDDTEEEESEPTPAAKKAAPAKAKAKAAPVVEEDEDDDELEEIEIEEL